MRNFTINEYAVDKVDTICVHSYDEVAKLMQLLADEYSFYVENDGCGNIFVSLESRHCNEFGSPRYMWVSAEEEEYLRDVRRDDDLVRARETVAAADDDDLVI